MAHLHHPTESRHRARTGRVRVGQQSRRVTTHHSHITRRINRRSTGIAQRQSYTLCQSQVRFLLSALLGPTLALTTAVRLGANNLDRDGVLGWHFIRPTMRLGYADGRRVATGERVSAQYPTQCEQLSTASWAPWTIPEWCHRPVLCRAGMHAAHTILDALRYAAPDWWLCRVRVWGRHTGVVCCGQRTTQVRYSSWAHLDDLGADSKFAGDDRTILWYVDFPRVLSTLGVTASSTASVYGHLEYMYDTPIQAEIALVSAVRRLGP